MRSTRLLVAVLFLCVFAGYARADAVTDWNLIAVQTLFPASPAPALRPGPSGALDVAMMHAAIYDAVQAIEREYQPYYVDIPNATGSSAAATARAAHDVLVSRFPAQAMSLGVIYQNYLITNGILLTDPGIVVGQRAAAGIIALRSCDGSFPNPAPPPFIGSTAIGQWRPTGTAMLPMNPGPWLGAVTPFTLTRTFQYRAALPPQLHRREYARDYNEVKAMGSLLNSSRTGAQTDLAQFWAGNFVVMMNEVLRQLSTARVPRISDSSRLFAMATMATADSMIATWNDKAHFNFWRPDTAIHNGDLDGNPATTGDPTWAPLIANPPYPDYGSGANGYAASTMHALEHFFGTENIAFSVTTTNTGPTMQDTRQFTKFSQATEEVVDARVYLGIHFRFADECSRELGKRVAKYGNDNYFRPVGEHSRGNGDELASARTAKP